MKKIGMCFTNKDTLGLLCIFFIGVVLLSFSASWALQPPRPGEVELMKAEGTYRQSLENAREEGNHKVSPVLVEKLKRKILKLKGFEQSDINLLAPAPPTGRQYGIPSSGSPNYFILLIEFADYSSTFSSTVMNDMHFGGGDPNDYPRESLANYYDRASYGLLDLSNGATLGWYNTGANRPAAPASNSGWAAARRALISDALNSFDATHDFSVYDNDGNGTIDYFIVYWTGPTGSWATYWWAWNTFWGDGGAYTIDGKTLNNYSWQPETDFPAVAIHETGHSLGLPDLYDYDDSVGPDGGVGSFDPMHGNIADLNCFWKWMLDWITPTVVSSSRQNLTLNDTLSEDAVLIWPGVSTSDLFSEFYMVQNRQPTGNDSDVWLNPDGLAIWHIDSSLNGAGDNFAYDNSYTAHKLIRLMEADGLEEIETLSAAADIGDLYSDGDEFGPETAPSSDKYDGSDSCVRVWNIVDDGTSPGDSLTGDFSTVCNTPPVSDANGPYIVECQGPMTTFMLDGTGSYDVDPGDIITYYWATDCPPTYVFDDYTNPTPQLSLATPDSNIPINCTVELTVTDTADDIDSDSSGITIVDTLAPDITCPADVTIECDESTDPAHTGVATATDICSPTVTIGYSDSVTPGECLNEETIERTWRATDTAGNIGFCTQTIDVIDSTPPITSCNAPAFISPNNAPISFAASAVDNCDEAPSVSITSFDCYKLTKKGKMIDKTNSCIVSVENNQITISDTGGVGAHITWTVDAADNCGNVSTEQCEVLVINPTD